MHKFNFLLNRYPLLRWSIHEIRQGQLWLISLALTLIIATVFSLTALSSRIELVIERQASQAMTADGVFISANPVPDVLLDKVVKLKSNATSESRPETSTMTRFATMAFSDAEMQLVMVKAVANNYPLQGELTLSNGENTFKNVKQNELWLEAKTFDYLKVSIGDTISIGDANFVISGKVIEQPGVSFNPFRQMPTVYINSKDIDKTGALQLGSRVQYRLFINADDSVITTLKESYALTASDRWQDRQSGSRSNDMFQKTEQYLSLTVAIVILMAAITLVITCQHYISTRMTSIAMLKSLGASKKWLSRWLMLQVTLLVVMASVMGTLLGTGLERLLRIPLVDILPKQLPSYGFEPFIIAIGTCLLIAIPALGIPLYRLLYTSSVNVLQKDNKAQVPKKRWLLILIPLLPTIFVYHSNQLIWLIIAAIILLTFVLALLGLGMSRLIAKISVSPSMTLALKRINSDKRFSFIQFGCLGLSLMLLATLWLVKQDLLSDWQQTIPINAPNAFALNIAPNEIAPYVDYLNEQNWQPSPAFPIARGRLVNINGEKAVQSNKTEATTDALSRELNLTWGDTLPTYNTLLEGKWGSKQSVSVESVVASDLGIIIGDQLTFVINSVEITATVNSIRDVEWREMKPNFYFIFSNDLFESFPATWLVSFRAGNDQQSQLTSLIRDYPTVSLIDVRIMGEKIQHLLQQIANAITVLALLALMAGMLLIYTLFRLSLAQRIDEVRLYRTLGCSQKRINATIWCEFGVMSLIASIVACGAAEAVVAAIMYFGFDLTPQWHPTIWLVLPLLVFGLLTVTLFRQIRSILTS